jgi:hypothetical protein
MKPDKKALGCNYAASTSPVSKGSLAFVLQQPGLNDAYRVWVLSRPGRYIEIWEPKKNLEKFRMKTVPQEHPFYDRIVEKSESDLEYATYGLD